MDALWSIFVSANIFYKLPHKTLKYSSLSVALYCFHWLRSLLKAVRIGLYRVGPACHCCKTREKWPCPWPATALGRECPVLPVHSTIELTLYVGMLVRKSWWLDSGKAHYLSVIWCCGWGRDDPSPWTPCHLLQAESWWKIGPHLLSATWWNGQKKDALPSYADPFSL